MSGDLEDAPVPMHLDYPHTHYSALVPANATAIDVDTTNRPKRAKPGECPNAPIALD